MSGLDDIVSRIAAADEAAARLEELHRRRLSRSAAFAEIEREAKRRHDAGGSARAAVDAMAALDEAATAADEAALAVIADLIARFEIPPVAGDG